MFKHKEDRIPTFLIVLLTVIDFSLFFTVESFGVVVIYWLIMIIPKGIIGAWNHHHQHMPTFKSNFVNRIMGQIYALHTGQTTHLWLLHHVLGHHMNYLDQKKDESRWAREDGTQMGALEYTLSVSITSYPRAYQVGKRFPKHQKIFLQQTGITIVLLVGLFVLNPLNALFLFLLPMIVSMMFTAWVTYDHHAGLVTDSPFEASYNIMNNVFNKLTGNLGYHTAHHYKQGMHWSKLPALHEEIKQNIPAELYVKSTFDAFLPNKSAKAS